MVLKDGSLYPSKELLAFHAIKMAGDCPIGHLDLVGTTRLVPFALNRGISHLTFLPTILLQRLSIGSAQHSAAI